jgi:thymidylate synthase
LNFTSYAAVAKALNKAKVVDRRTKELVNVNLELRNPEDMFFAHNGYEPNYGYFSRLLAFYLRGRSHSLDGMDHYTDDLAKAWSSRLTVNGDHKYQFDINSNYGVYVWNPTHGYHSQFDLVLRRLRDGSASRQAIILFNRPEVNTNGLTTDHICTTSLQFLIRDRQLHLITTMRSNDFYAGYDIPFFMTLQQIAVALLSSSCKDLKCGQYFHNVGSYHCYEKDWDKLAKFTGLLAELRKFQKKKMWPPTFGGYGDVSFMLNQFGPFEEMVRHTARSPKDVNQLGTAAIEELLESSNRKCPRSIWHLLCTVEDMQKNLKFS